MLVTWCSCRDTGTTTATPAQAAMKARRMVWAFSVSTALFPTPASARSINVSLVAKHRGVTVNPEHQAPQALLESSPTLRQRRAKGWGTRLLEGHGFSRTVKAVIGRRL